jgi:hypothetical protein
VFLKEYMVISRSKSSMIPDLSISEIRSNNNSQIEKIYSKIIELKRSMEELKEGLEEGNLVFISSDLWRTGEEIILVRPNEDKEKDHRTGDNPKLDGWNFPQKLGRWFSSHAGGDDSANRKQRIDKDGHLFLRGHQSRVYDEYENYNTKVIFSFIPDDNFPNGDNGDNHALQIKRRSRHNYKIPPKKNAFGGYGIYIQKDEIKAKREVVHGNDEEIGEKKKLPKEIVLNKPHRCKYNIRDEEKDGKTVVRLTVEIDWFDNEGFLPVLDVYDNNPKEQMIDKQKFLEKGSMGYWRIDGKGEVQLYDIEIYDLDKSL